MIGTVFRVRYEVTQEVSRGPIFTSYLARDRVEGREACVRVLQSDLAQDRDVARRLFSVVMKYSGIRSSGLESLIEVDEDQGSTFLVSEFTRGITLAERIKKLAPFSVPVSLATMISVCEALSALHTTSLPHGDLRPENVMVLVDGQVKLQLAGVWECYSASPHVGALILPLMAPYLAPEISDGGMPTPTSDVYAAGIMLYELIAGRLPFSGDTAVATAIKHATAAVPSVRMYNPSVPLVLDEIVKKAMAKDPTQRYRSANDLLHDLRIMQDALRFGRSLTWPLQNPAIEETVESAPIAPRMSAVRPEPKPIAPREKRERIRGDVPAWIFMLMAFFGAVVAMMVITWMWQFSHKAKEVKVPKVIGLKVTEAEHVLKDAGLVMRIVGPPVEGKGPPDMVVAQLQGAGERVREGSTIGVRKSAGPATISVPRLIGMSEDAARAFLERSDLKLDDVIEHVNRNGAQEGQIVEQRPTEYTSVAKGTRVKIVVQANDGPAQNIPEPGDENIQARYHLKVRLAGLKESVQLRIAIVDAQGTRDVVNQTGRPEQEIEVNTIGFGRQVTFQVFYNGTRVFEQRQAAPAGALPRPSPSPSEEPTDIPTDIPIETPSDPPIELDQ